jgi:hypothetical protein
MGSVMQGQKVFQEFWGSAQRWFTSISLAVRSGQAGQ